MSLITDAEKIRMNQILDSIDQCEKAMDAAIASEINAIALEEFPGRRKRYVRRRLRACQTYEDAIAVIASPHRKRMITRERDAILRIANMLPRGTGDYEVQPGEFNRIAFREARLKRGMSQERLAKKVGASVSYISAIEQGKRVPSIETFGDWAKTAGWLRESIDGRPLPTPEYLSC